jgi:hypothetical protein
LIDTAKSWAILESFGFARGLGVKRRMTRGDNAGEGEYERRAKLERKGHRP